MFHQVDTYQHWPIDGASEEVGNSSHTHTPHHHPSILAWEITNLAQEMIQTAAEIHSCNNALTQGLVDKKADGPTCSGEVPQLASHSLWWLLYSF